MLLLLQASGEPSDKLGGLVTVPFEFVAVAVGVLVTTGLVYLVHRLLEDRR